MIPADAAIWKPSFFYLSNVYLLWLISLSTLILNFKDLEGGDVIQGDFQVCSKGNGK